MILRPLDASGDILPVLSISAVVSGPEAVAQLVKFRLSLMKGEWWENPEWGFFLLETMQSSRLTEAEISAVSAQITEYIRKTDGVHEVEDVRCTVADRQLSYSCSVRTEEGTADLSLEIG